MRRVREAGDTVDVVIITPEPGRQKEIGQKLLALADHPNQVQWVTYPQTGFQIPLELFAKFDTAEGEPEEAPQPRRRGRPRREPSTDNNTSEEE